MEELRFKVVIDDSLPVQLDEPAVALGSFEPSDKILVYPSDAEGFGLRQFYSDLILGRPLPLRLVTREVEDVDDAFTLALFLDRKLAIHPTTPAVIAALDLARCGPAGLAHVDRDLARFISFSRSYLGEKAGREERIKTVIEWLRQYVVEGVFPSLPPEPKPPRVLDVGTNGFVLAEAASGADLVDGWVELYRLGHLRGMLFGAASPEGQRLALGARKSSFVAMGLEKAAGVLNEAERAMGELPGWVADSLWLWGPQEGTLLLPTHIIEVLVRV